MKDEKGVPNLSEITMIRDILMGEQMADYDRRYEQINHKIEDVTAHFKQVLDQLQQDYNDRLQLMQQTFDHRLDELEKLLKKNVDHLDKKLENVSREDKTELGKLLANLSTQLMKHA